MVWLVAPRRPRRLTLNPTTVGTARFAHQFAALRIPLQAPPSTAASCCSLIGVTLDTFPKARKSLSAKAEPATIIEDNTAANAYDFINELLVLHIQLVSLRSHFVLARVRRKITDAKLLLARVVSLRPTITLQFLCHR